MSNARRMTRQALTIARRDFTATVFTPTFLLFLLAPLIMMSFGLIGGVGASTLKASDVAVARLVAIIGSADAHLLRDADARFRRLYRPGQQPP